MTLTAINHEYDIDIKADPVEIQLPENQQGTVTVSLTELKPLSEHIVIELFG
jgi:hypothetical protein